MEEFKEYSEVIEDNQSEEHPRIILEENNNFVSGSNVDSDYKPESDESEKDDEESKSDESEKDDIKLDEKLKKEQEKKEERHRVAIAKLRRKNNEYKNEIKQMQEKYNSLIDHSHKSDLALSDGIEIGIQASLKMLEKELESSILEQDVQKQVQTSKKMAELISQQELIKEKKYAQQAYQQSYKQQYNPEIEDKNEYDPDIDDNEYRADWVKRNSWANEKSENFNPEMVEEMCHVAGLLKNEFKRKGKEHLIYQRDYFNKLDDYARENFFENTPRNVQQKFYKSNQSPVRGASSTARLKVPALSREMKETCATYGIPEDVFIKNWEKTLKENKLAKYL